MSTSGVEEVEESLPARLTPYELAFPASRFETGVFAEILDEAESRGARTGTPAEFLMLGLVGSALREQMPGPGEDEGGESSPDPGAGQVLDEYGRLFFQAYHFWRFGKRLIVPDTQLVRKLVDDMPTVGDWMLTPPYPAGYLQLPRHLFWVALAPGSPPEPVDGIFWTMIGEDDPAEPPYRRLDLVAVAGMRAGRPGFSTIGVAADLVGTKPGHWADADARPDGRDFASVLPGGDIDRLYSLTTTLEVLKLVSLAFWYMATHREAVRQVEPPAPGTLPMPGPHELPPSALPYERVGLIPEDDAGATAG